MKIVLQIALGPVQEFIERARRTRDLWFGSHLLSEVSRAVARYLAQEGGWTLVFPALDAHDPELERCSGTLRPSGHPPMGIVNKVVATHENLNDVKVQAHAEAARQAGIEAWQFFAAQAMQEAPGLVAAGLAEQEHPRNAIHSLLESYVGWTSYETDEEYSNALDQVEAQVDARKRLRDFQTWGGGPFNKSSLDGFRESVLVDRERKVRPRHEVRRLRLEPTEHLDGIALVKRAGGKPKQFVPVARVAVEPWLKAVQEAALTDPALARHLEFLDLAADRDDVPGCDRSATRWLANSPRYDGQILFEDRWARMDAEILGEEAVQAGETWCSHHVGPLFRRFGLPAPHQYVACLRADGDRMGPALGKLKRADRHRDVSRALSGFAKGVRAIVEAHEGLLIYAGGDDVLALLSVRKAVNCADALQRSFLKALEEVIPSETPTLSVGVALMHVLTPLGELAAEAREAEKYAKQGDDLPDGDPRQRNAIAVLASKRKGEASGWRRQWSEAPDPQAHLKQICEHLVSGAMPRGVVTELQHVRMELERFSDPHGSDRTGGQAFRNEVLRILARKRPDGGERLTPARIGLTLPGLDQTSIKSMSEHLSAWVDAARIATFLADAERNLSRIIERQATAEIA